MPFKINIAEKTGKTYKLELESEELLGKKLHEKIPGKELLADLEGYEFEIAGASDKAGFAAHEDVPGIGLKKILLSYGKAMKKRPRREGKMKVSNPTPKGLRLRKTARGNTISPAITQINLKILKEGKKKLSEIFSSQNKPKEPEKKPEEAKKPAEEAGTEPKQEKKTEQETKPEETKENPKEEEKK